MPPATAENKHTDTEQKIELSISKDPNADSHLQPFKINSKNQYLYGILLIFIAIIGSNCQNN